MILVSIYNMLTKNEVFNPYDLKDDDKQKCSNIKDQLSSISDEYAVNKEYYRTILRRISTLQENIPRKMSVQSTLITAYGLKRNEYSRAFLKVITLDDLFYYRKY